MRNHSCLSVIKTVSIKGHYLSVRQALPLARLFCQAFESDARVKPYIQGYLSGSMTLEDLELSVTPSELKVLETFMVWYRREYAPGDNTWKPRSYLGVAFCYNNLNTGFSLVFLKK